MCPVTVTADVAVKNAVSNSVKSFVVFDIGRSNRKAVKRINKANPIANMNGVVTILCG